MQQYPMRHALTDLKDPIVSQWEGHNRARVDAWWGTTAAGDYKAIEALENDGIYLCPAGDIVGKADLANAHERIAQEVCTRETQAKIEELKQQPWKDFCLLSRYSAVVLEKHPVLRVALTPHLLKTVAGYMGLWPRLVDICVHINYPTETEASASQLWHRDPGDIKLCKVFIYLCDVSFDNGPFCYIPGTQSFGRLASVVPEKNGAMPIPSEREIRWTDDEVAKVFPESQWKVAIGPTHTMILADTVGIHRGLKPVSGGRILVCFTYASGIAGTLMPKMTPPAWAKEECQQWALR